MNAKNLNEAIHNLALEAERFDSMVEDTMTKERRAELSSRWCDACRKYTDEETYDVEVNRLCAYHRYSLFPRYFDENGDVRPIK